MGAVGAKTSKGNPLAFTVRDDGTIGSLYSLNRLIQGVQ